MLRNQVYVEILNASHAISLQNAALTGAISRLLDRLCQSEVLVMSNNAKLQIPRTSRHELDIYTPYLIIQAFIPKGKQFNIEISVTDTSAMKRKLIFTQCRGIIRNSLHSRIQNTIINRDQWTNICIDVSLFNLECFGSTFHHIDSVTISGFCRIRKIFGCKFPLKDSNERMNTQLKHEILPDAYEFPDILSALSQIINPGKISVETPLPDAPSRVANYSPNLSKRQEYFLEDSPQRSIKIKRKNLIESKVYDKLIMGQFGPNPFKQSKHNADFYSKSIVPQKSTPQMAPPPIRTKPNRRTIFNDDAPQKESKSFRISHEDNSFIGLNEYGVDIKPKSSLYEQYMGAVTTIRHHTPPFVNLDNEGLTYDPVSKNYSLPAEVVWRDNF
ncbi:unnamed protein product [Blepharisma stoltei]|uniref:CFA20 domain-containing protein n=1 Tax=Blepharisma stoltei TaxID=1481888 RepID=A0AAU9JIJ2_9CILI|nr:unnamed protein product [Blepharisma stoltei]